MAYDAQHNSDRRDVSPTAGSSTPIHDDARPLHLASSSTDTSLTRAANNDHEGNASNEPVHANDTTNGDDDDEKPDTDVDPHLANGHGKGGYGEHHEEQRSSGNGREEEEDVIIVDWDGPDDPCNPRKCVLKFCPSFVALSNKLFPCVPPHSWSYKKKWAATAIVSAFTFMSPLSSSMIAPASDQLSSEFGETNTVVIAMYTSIFVLAYGAWIRVSYRSEHPN